MCMSDTILKESNTLRDCFHFCVSDIQNHGLSGPPENLTNPYPSIVVVLIITVTDSSFDPPSLDLGSKRLSNTVTKIPELIIFKGRKLYSDSQF